MIFLWSPFSCECAGKPFQRHRKKRLSFSKSHLCNCKMCCFPTCSFSKIKSVTRKTFVSSFGVYFWNPFVSFSDITGNKDEKTIESKGDKIKSCTQNFYLRYQFQTIIQVKINQLLCRLCINITRRCRY